ncbi:MAG: ABC transporter permease [Actinomycetota bacterium]
MADLFIDDGADGGAGDDRVRSGGSGQALQLFLRNRAAVFGLLLLIGVFVMAFIVPIWYVRDPGDLVARPHLPPGSDDAPLLGTDNLGRDILASVVYGGRTTLRVAAGAAVIIIAVGVTIGSLAGYYGGRIDNALMRLTEFFQVLPGLLFAIVVVALFEPSFWTITFAIGSIAWPGIARLTRAEFLRLKNLEFVKAARAIGSSDLRIITRVILPNALPTLIVSSTLIMGSAILFEAGLAFLGLADVNTTSWGLAIGRGREFFTINWWAVTFPGLAIFATVLGLSLVGDGLQDAFNPRLRGR